MKKFVLIFGLLVVVSIQPRLFAPNPIEMSDEEEDDQEYVFNPEAAENGVDVGVQADEGDAEAGSAEAEDESGEGDEGEEAYDNLVYEAIAKARSELGGSAIALCELAELYSGWGYHLTSETIDSVRDKLDDCVKLFNEFDKHRGKKLELVERNRTE